MTQERIDAVTAINKAFCAAEESMKQPKEQFYVFYTALGKKYDYRYLNRESAVTGGFAYSHSNICSAQF